MIFDKLAKHKYAQCAHYIDGDEYGFMSYTTKVIIIRGDRIIYTGPYSCTTSRQVNWFLQEYREEMLKDNQPFLTWDDLKEAYENSMAIDTSMGFISFKPLTDKEKDEIKSIRRKAFNYGYGW